MASKNLRDAFRPWLFLALPLTFYLVLIAYPILYSFAMSFFSWDGISAARKFVRVDNYIEFFTNPRMAVALKNNFIWMLFFVPMPIVIGFVLAHSLANNSAVNIVLRSVFYIPMILAFTVMSIIWGWVYEPTRGIITEGFKLLHLTPPTRSLVTNEATSMLAIAVVGVWYWVGFPLVLYTAAIKDIPEELFDAADIDGANRLQRMRFIIVPMVSHATQVCVSIGLVLSVKTFDLVFLMSGGYYKNEVLSTLVWKLFSQFRIGPASAVSVIQFALAFLLVVPYQAWNARKGTVQY